jgi:hypothetical protein
MVLLLVQEWRHLRRAAGLHLVGPHFPPTSHAPNSFQAGLLPCSLLCCCSLGQCTASHQHGTMNLPPTPFTTRANYVRQQLLLACELAAIRSACRQPCSVSTVVVEYCLSRCLFANAVKFGCKQGVRPSAPCTASARTRVGSQGGHPRAFIRLERRTKPLAPLYKVLHAC